MKASELMIGDWVKSRGQIEQIRMVYEGYICTDRFEDSHDFYFEPIPLTPEILEKNGFRKGMREYTLIHFEKNELPISLNPLAGGGFEWTDSDCVAITEVSYVHELQHALKLCGIEKEIIL